MIEMLTSGLDQIRGLIALGITVAAAAYIAAVWWRTRALVPTLTAIALSAVVVWASSNVSFLSERVQEDSEGWLTAPTVGAGDDPAGTHLGVVA